METICDDDADILDIMRALVHGWNPRDLIPLLQSIDMRISQALAVTHLQQVHNAQTSIH